MDLILPAFPVPKSMDLTPLGVAVLRPRADGDFPREFGSESSILWIVQTQPDFPESPGGFSEGQQELLELRARTRGALSVLEINF